MISTSINKKIFTVMTLSLVLFSQQLFAAWPATATQSSTQYTQLTTNAQRGRWLWLKNNCMGCHGDNAGGGMGPNVQRTELGDIHEAVSGGEGGMPGYKKITATDITMLTSYLNSIGTPTEPKFICWWKYPIKDLTYNGTGVRPNCNP